MGFWDFLQTANGARLTAQADEAKTLAARDALALQDMRDRQSARSKLVGGSDPNSADSSINWSPMAAPTGTAQMQDANGNWKQYSLLGDTPTVKKQDTMNLLTADPNAPAPVGSPDQPPQDEFAGKYPSIAALQSAFKQQDPNAYTNQRSQWLSQADPDTALKNQQGMQARQASMNMINSLDVPGNVKQAMLVESIAPKTAEALGKNLETPDGVKNVNTLMAGLNSAKPGSTEYNTYKSLLTQATQNLPAAQLAETMRHNRADEANSNLTMGTDENGMPAIIDKRAKSIVPLVPNPFGAGTAAPPALGQPASPQAPLVSAANAPEAAGAAQPVYDQVAATDRSPERRPWLGAPTASLAQPPKQTAQPVYQDSYIKSLSPEAQAKFGALPPGVQYQLGPILAGKTSPPESGRAITDPQTKNILRMAAYVDPDFNEQTWRARNEAALQRADSKNPGSTGAQVTAAKTLLGHLTDLAKVGVEMNNTSVLGPGGNSIDNWAANQLPTAIGGDPAFQAKLRHFREHAQGGAGELGKITSGGPGTQSEKSSFEANFPEDGNLEAILGGAGGAADMMQKRIQSQLEAYNKTMKTKETLADWLGPESYAQYKVLTKLSADAMAGKKIKPADARRALAAVSNPTEEAAPQGDRTSPAPLDIGKTVNINGAAITRVK